MKNLIKCFISILMMIPVLIFADDGDEPILWSIPLTENFEGTWSSGAPNNIIHWDGEYYHSIWTKEFVWGATNWQQYSGCIYNESGGPGPSPAGGYNALIYQEDWSGPETYLITPALDFGSSIYNAKLSFWHVQRAWDGDHDELFVYYRIPVWHSSTNKFVGSWILLASFTDTISDWIQTTIDLPSVGPRYQIAFKGYAYYGYGVGLDKVEVTASETPVPIELTLFTARSEERSVVLEWKTRSETENVGYILEKKTNNSGSWLKLADYQTHEALRGQGTTSCPSEYVFVDVEVVPGESYSYRLSDVSESGNIVIHPSIDISMSEISKTQIEKIYPNPFNPQTCISYSVQEDSDVKIRVYDIFGRIVKTLQNGDQVSGFYHVYWNGSNDSNTQAPSGMYFIQMRTENTHEIQKVVLMK